ncbi:integrase catalytic domain-containing protein [Trichonephila clavipes]|nr:integrase catalytic domain-containing protein [Trichonephila clavipes]
MGKETVNHGLFVGIVKKGNHRIYCLNLSNIDKSFSLDVNVMDQEKICVPLAKFNDISSVSEMKRLGILMCDTSINENVCLYEKDPNEVHILLGADIASEILTGEIKHLHKGLVAVSTKLGWTVLGKVKSSNSYMQKIPIFCSLFMF